MEFLNRNVKLFSMKLFPHHLLGLRHLERADLEEIFRVTEYYKKLIVKKESPERILENKSALNLFFEDSTRTKTSFELVEKKLGMDVVNFTEAGSSFSKGESLFDTVKNIEAMKFDYIVVRHSVPGTAVFLSSHTTSRIINAGDGSNEHPTQGLLDIYTLRENFGSLKNLNVCIVGDISHSRVALSNIFGLRKMEANVSVCGPVSFIPKYLEGLGVNVFTDIEEAVRKSDVLNILRVQLERNAGVLLPSLKEYSRHYGITEDRLRMNKKLKILHPGPMNINVELDYFTSVSEQSLIFDQVTNGAAVKCAVFKLMNDFK